MKVFRTLLFIFCLCLFSCAKITEPNQPNIIYILADDLGYGDLGCYGQQKIKTPHLDKMAANGLRFTQHYSGCTVCAPSRSVLLTGLHTGHTPIRGNKEIKPEGQAPLPESTKTFVEILCESGYVTGAFGKWGLGFTGSTGDPNNTGFDEFFGYNCQRQAHRYYPNYLWENGSKFFLKGNDWSHKVTYAPDVIQDKALDFIRNNKEKPFFMYYLKSVQLLGIDAELSWEQTDRGMLISLPAKPSHKYAYPVRIEFTTDIMNN